MPKENTYPTKVNQTNIKRIYSLRLKIFMKIFLILSISKNLKSVKKKSAFYRKVTTTQPLHLFTFRTLSVWDFYLQG